MPSYRTGKIVGRERTILRWSKGEKQSYIQRIPWFSDSTQLKHVEKVLTFPIQPTIAKLCKTTSPTVVDWGCAKGVSSGELARNNPNAKVYGFSKESYKEWNRLLNKDAENSNKPNKNLRFIHNEANDFFKYFKKESIDFLFSHFGLFHLRDVPAYLIRLVPKLKKGGIIVTNCSNPGETYSQLKNASKTSALSGYVLDIKLLVRGILIKRIK